MEYLVVLLLGIGLGFLVIYLARPGLFVSPQRDFAALEAMFDSLMEELEHKQEEFLHEIQTKEQRLRSLQTDIEMQDTSGTPPKVQAVHRLLEEGFDVTTIAQRLGLGCGEVELIAELKNPRENP